MIIVIHSLSDLRVQCDAIRWVKFLGEDSILDHIANIFGSLKTLNNELLKFVFSAIPI